MYGYLKWKKPRKGLDKLTNTYKCYYCGLCNAMKRNYGLRTLFFLSNDITFILISIYQCIGQCAEIPQCCAMRFRKKIDKEFSNKRWRHLAALTVGIAYAKALDNYQDERNLGAFLKFWLVKIISSKARTDNRELFDFLGNSIKQIAEEEKKGIDLMRQSVLTANMLVQAIQFNNEVCLNSVHCAYILALSRWLCLVDALDDYEKDLKEMRYNPFFIDKFKVSDLTDDTVAGENTSKQIFISTYYGEIASIYKDIIDDMTNTLEKMDVNGNEGEILYAMTYKNMPEIFFKTLQRSR